MSVIRQSLAFSVIAIGMAAPCFGDKLAVMPGNEASRENFQVNKRISWKTDLNQAKDEAAKSGRLIFWVHMLGSMDGKT